MKQERESWEVRQGNRGLVDAPSDNLAELEGWERRVQESWQIQDDDNWVSRPVDASKEQCSQPDHKPVWTDADQAVVGQTHSAQGKGMIASVVAADPLDADQLAFAQIMEEVAELEQKSAAMVAANEDRHAQLDMLQAELTSVGESSSRHHVGSLYCQRAEAQLTAKALVVDGPNLAESVEIKRKHLGRRASGMVFETGGLKCFKEVLHHLKAHSTVTQTKGRPGLARLRGATNGD